MTRTNNKGLLVLSYIVASLPSAKAAELKSETAAAFNRYVNGAEARMAEDLCQGHFLVVDDLLGERPAAGLHATEQGRLSVEPLRAKGDGNPIPVPGGLIYDWVGVAFIPGVTLPQTGV